MKEQIFSGWAKQLNERTVQEEVEKALSTIIQTKVATIVAGRTDAVCMQTSGYSR
ncbi:tRNA pseudouridine synthase A [Actinomycetota bacterium]|nr:tRNA pseudouridine synthase A [Actinomycetota bacterium]